MSAALSLALASQSFGRQSPAITSGTQEVLLDLVVRDKHRRLLRDLRAGEVEVLEDGIPQQIRSFEFVRAKGSKLLNGEAPDRFDPLHELNIITLVFQEMSNQGRVNAASMAREFLSNQFSPNTLLGAYAMNRQLYLLQPFTNRHELLNGAVDTIAKANYTRFARISAENLESLNKSLYWPGDVDPGAPTLDSTRKNDNSADDHSHWQSFRLGDASERGPVADPVVRRLQQSIEKLESLVMRDAQSLYSTASLLALIRVLAAVPGRKTVLLFSEGISLNVSEHSLILKRVVDEANRANIAFYTVNTNGLQNLGPDGLAQASFDWLPLRELAESTGGLSMADSNDLRAPLRRVVEDSTSHYELFYKPKSQDFDGRFRRVEVRISRPGVTFQSRDGYFALPLIAGQLVQSFEIECLKALNETTRPHAFSFRRRALRFNAIGDQAQYQLVIEIPSSVPRLTMQSGGNVLTGGLSVLALLKDDAGKVVNKASRSLGLKIERAELDRFQRLPLTIALPFAAPPGQFTLEIAVVDQSSHQASAQVVPLGVGPVIAPEVSDIAVVGSLLHSQEPGGDVLGFGDQRVVLSLQDSFSAGKVKNLPVFFTVYCPGSQASVEAHLELRHAGRVVTTATPTAQVRETQEVVSFLATIPIADSPKGAYDLVVTATVGAWTGAKTLRFEIE